MQTANAKHTTGPWLCHLGRGANPRFHVQTTSGYQIASTTAIDSHPMAAGENAERDANARLIAAAPELLEACERALESIERNLSAELLPETRDFLRAAIAKATR